MTVMPSLKRPSSLAQLKDRQQKRIALSSSVPVPTVTHNKLGPIPNLFQKVHHQRNGRPPLPALIAQLDDHDEIVPAFPILQANAILANHPINHDPNNATHPELFFTDSCSSPTTILPTKLFHINDPFEPATLNISGSYESMDIHSSQFNVSDILHSVASLSVNGISFPVSSTLDSAGRFVSDTEDDPVDEVDLWTTSGDMSEYEMDDSDSQPWAHHDSDDQDANPTINIPTSPHSGSETIPLLTTPSLERPGSTWSITRRITFTSKTPFSQFQKLTFPIIDPDLLTSVFTTTASSTPADLIRFTVNHRYPSFDAVIPPSTIQPLSSILASSTQWPPSAVKPSEVADLQWYINLVDRWQTALRWLGRSIPKSGFYMVQPATTHSINGGFSVVVSPQDGALVAGASRGMRRAMIDNGVRNMRPIASTHGIVSRTARQAVRFSARTVIEPMRMDMEDLGGEGHVSNSAYDLVLDPATSILHVPNGLDLHALLAFLVDWPKWNIHAAHVPNPVLPVLLSADAFPYSAFDCAKVSKCAAVETVNGKAFRMQIDGWMLPDAVNTVKELVLEKYPETTVSTSIEECADYPHIELMPLP